MSESELPNLSDKERRLLDCASGYLMRQCDIDADRKPLKYIADLIILVRQLDNRMTANTRTRTPTPNTIPRAWWEELKKLAQYHAWMTQHEAYWISGYLAALRSLQDLMQQIESRGVMISRRIDTIARIEKVIEDNPPYTEEEISLLTKQENENMNDGERMEDYGNAVQEELIPAEECCGETGCEHKTALSLEDIEECIVTEVYEKLGLKTTCVVLTLQNGFEVVGTSSCVDPANYNHEIGCKIARQRAVDKVWELEGYKLQSKLKSM